MEKQKRWHFFLILTVIALTVYNILPTVFYYTKPLKAPIDQSRAELVGKSALHRVNDLEKNSIEWTKSFAKLLHIKPKSVIIEADNPSIIQVDFLTTEDASKFRKFLPRAGSLVPFAPAKLSLIQEKTHGRTVSIQRQIPIQFDLGEANKYFTFSEKFDQDGKTTPLYNEIVTDRLVSIGESIAGESENANYVDVVLHTDDPVRRDEFLFVLAQNISSYAKVFGKSPKIENRFFSTFTRSDSNSSITSLLSAFNGLKDRIKIERIELEDQASKAKENKTFLTSEKQQKLAYLKKRESLITKATATISSHKQVFESGSQPWTKDTIAKAIRTSKNGTSKITFGNASPLIDKLSVDWNSGVVTLNLHKDVADLKDSLRNNSKKRRLKDQLDQLIINEVATIANASGEKLIPIGNEFEISLNDLTGSSSFLSFNLGEVAKAKANELVTLLKTKWHPAHSDLKSSVFPIWTEEEFSKLSKEERQFGLLVYAPAASNIKTPKGLKDNSVYVVAKGVDQILKKLQSDPSAPQSKVFLKDFQALQTLLHGNGFIGFAGNTFPLSRDFARDYIFEDEDYYQAILSATRENFAIHGTKKYAILEFTNVEQRILTTNQIETKIHEDLLKWKDEYNQARVNTNSAYHFDVPKPTQNALIANLALSSKKYFRGDERKVLHWGLDLTGGKSVQIELRDSNNRVVKNDAELAQGINELYRRVNKMGVSEVSIRQEGTNITLDFPGTQGLSASDLVQASTMYFHVVNEKFTPNNRDITESVNRFLQDVWNEAVITGKKDIESINQIAWKHLYGDAQDAEVVQPVSDAAQTLYDHGLKLAHPNDMETSSAFNDQISKIAMMRGDTFTDWQGQTNPLLIVFKNYALEGSNLENVHASYDASSGNFLSFEVRGTASNKNVKLNPRTELHTWTNAFAKDSISDTPLAAYSASRGWRMAVILNGTVISSPNLDSALDRQARITGSFSQREVNKLEADLKAGSLSYAPKILSEKNISPDLGLKDRYKGILATAVALIAVMALMISYYRFAGTIASVAVIFNLLIMWATLQNIQATITLAGIAGMILVVGMAVDANVLVFERIREEFAQSGRIAQSVRAGYSKAFSAILDSNVTTVIAAVILLNFDSGPIKGFAVTLIIGIVSSMFTALFMTRFFFAGWVRNPKNTSLTMSSWITKPNFNFLKYAKVAMGITVAVALVGGFFFVEKRNTILGMDFSGGFALTTELEKSKDTDYRLSVMNALAESGLSSQDFQVKELTPTNNVKILLSSSLDQKGKVFYDMPLETSESDPVYSYETNPRIAYVVNALQKAGLELPKESLEKLDSNWINVSGQMSKTMRNNALIGLGLALLCILIYITFRFEFKFAISATIGLAVDVIFTLAMMGLLHALNVPIQLDLNTIAALMTIIGYSLNDTIIIFDRIRENLRVMRKSSLRDVINSALNITLSRTLMTSGTTLIVLLALVILGGSTIFGLALVMIIGVVFGTLSSLFISAPLLHYFEKKETVEKKKLAFSK